MTSQLYIDDSISARIDRICLNLKHSVTAIQIVNWLNNFEKPEWTLALTVLENIKYFTASDILQEYDSWLDKIISTTPKNSKLFIHGLGDFGKSGSSMMYYLLKTPAFKNREEQIKILTHVIKLDKQGVKNGDTLILLDDIIGSGESLITYYNHHLKGQLLRNNLSISIKVLCISYILESVDKINSRIDNFSIYGNGYQKAFVPSGSVFGYRPRMLEVREFCYKYGIQLFSIYDRQLKRDIPHPLGYNKSQALVVFVHSVPNNTLPIIWSTKRGWHPIFARAAETKISESKEFIKESRYWLSIAYKLDLISKPPDGKSIYNSNIDFKIISIIRLKKRNRNDASICQIIGISVIEYERILNDALEKGLFDSSGNLTEKGSQIYDNIRTRIRRLETIEQIKPVYLPEERPYVPKKFLGKG